MNFKKFVAFGLTLLMGTSILASCGEEKAKDDNTTADAKPTVEEKTPVEITWWAFPVFKKVNDESGKYEQQLADAFMAKHPEIKVKVEMIDFKTGPEKLVSAIEGNTAPDVLFDAPGRIIEYGRAGKLVKLNDMFAETKLAEDITSEGLLKACSDGQNYWMYPTSAAPFVMAVNKTALEKEGLLDKVPLTGDRTWTTEQFIALSKEMQAKGYKGVEIYCGGQGGDQGTRAFITNLTGASIMNSDLSAYTMDTAEGVEAYKLIAQGVEEGWLEGNTAGQANDALEHFTTPTNSTFWAVNLWNSTLAGLREKELKDSNIEAVPVSLPSKNGKPQLEYLVNGYAIFDNKDEAKIAAAKEFVKFLADDETVGKQNVLAASAFPVRKSFGNLYGDDELMSYYASVSQYYGKYYNTVPNFAQMRAHWWGSLQFMLSKEKTPEEAAKFFTTEANKTLAEK